MSKLKSIACHSNMLVTGDNSRLKNLKIGLLIFHNMVLCVL